MSHEEPPSPTLALLERRFEIERTLGHGANGVVYAARERTTDFRVALKTLLSPDAATLFRMKQEFRSLAGIHHPNLVELYELVVEAESSFFTMELVDGVSFLDFVRAEGKPDYDRLRDGLVQLAEGLRALHERGKLHRDVKPANVLVDRQGRLVLLDFGLSTDLHSTLSRNSREGEIAGTLAYMAPESLWDGTVSPESDWYSVGVLLYECLTGGLPCDPDRPQGVLRPRRFRPPPPGAVAPESPADLADAAVALLDPDPKARPGGAELLARIRRAPASATPDTSSARPEARPARPFVGRFEELGKLRRAFSASLRGESVLVRIRGLSGMGKTALVERFLSQLEAERDVVCLRARCQPQETVPYNVIDGLVDQLSRYLKHRSETELDVLRPVHVDALIRLFPVLGRVGFATRPERDPPENEPHVVRRRAESALRELLGRLADRVSLVLWVDDVHWGDPASASLLRAVLAPPEAPPLLLLLSYRSEDREKNPLLVAIEAQEAVEGLDADLAVGPLDRLDARDLADTLLAQGGIRRETAVRRISEESQGSPFFIGQLAQSLISRQAGGAGDLGDVGLESVVRRRLESLTAPERRLLASIAVNPGALELSLALTASELGPAGHALVDKLADQCMIRVASSDDGRALELYHDRIREALLAHLHRSERVACHLALAARLEERSDAPLDVLAHHLHGAGRLEPASACAERAAGVAAEAFAFLRAADLYRLAGAWSADPDRAGALARRRADALVMAGRCADAAPLYLAAAKRADGNAAFDLRRLALEQLLVSGQIDEGLAILRPLLREFGFRYPRTPRSAMAFTLARLARFALRGLPGPRGGDDAADPARLRESDLCYSAARGLIHVDSVRAVYLAFLALERALRIGDPVRVVRSLGAVGPLLAPAGGFVGRWGHRFVDEARRIAQDRGDPYLIAVATLAAGARAMMQGSWQASLDCADRAMETLRAECQGASWECTMASMVALRALEELGRYADGAARARELADESRILGNRHGAIVAAQYGAHAAIARGEGARALAPLHDGLSTWSQEGFHIQHFYALRLEVYRDVHDEAYGRAWDRLQHAWKDLERSSLVRFVLPGADAYLLRARTALALARHQTRDRRRLLALCQRDARRVSALAFGATDAFAAALRAGVARVAGRPEDARREIEAAIPGFAREGLAAYEASAERFRGRLLGGDDGARTVNAAEERLRGAGVADPARWSEILCPGV